MSKSPSHFGRIAGVPARCAPTPIALFFLFVCLTLTSCGFHLRGTQEMPMHLKTIAILPDSAYTPLQRDIRKALRHADVEIVASPTGVYSLQLDNDNLSRSIMVIGTDGQAKQEELIYTLHYRIIPPGADPLPPQVIKVQRILNVDFNRTLGQAQEEDTLIGEMRAEITAQLMRRLSVIEP